MRKLLEYEGKELLKNNNIRIPRGRVASNVDEAIEIAKNINNFDVVIKAQVLAGGRGLVGGIKFVNTKKETEEEAEKLLNSKIKGLDVNKILIEEKLDIENEIYVSFMLDRTDKMSKLIGSVQGGVNIEEVSNSNPAAISQITIDPLIGTHDYHGLYLFNKFDISINVKKNIADIITKLYGIYKNQEAFLVEINPLVITKKNEVIAADCKIIIDPAASYIESNDFPRYIPLDGNIGVFANGAGLTMATMDVVKEFGVEPANFLEVGGDHYKKAGEALEFLLQKKEDSLDGLIINLFGAYARTDIIIEQVIDVLKKRNLTIPISFRIKGTGEERAKKMVENELNKKVHMNIESAVQQLLSEI